MVHVLHHYLGLCRCILDDVRSTNYEEQANWAGTLAKAKGSVRDHPMRIYDVRSLGSLKFIGPAVQEVGRCLICDCFSVNMCLHVRGPRTRADS
jgi:hypothetical protein